jgi:hypothetical protein
MHDETIDLEPEYAPEKVRFRPLQRGAWIEGQKRVDSVDKVQNVAEAINS